jgi:hypothetical protein
VTGASRFLIGLVTCLATHDGITPVSVLLAVNRAACRMTTEHQIRKGSQAMGQLQVEAELVYTVIAGIPVRNYRAEGHPHPTADGTHVRWAATWDATLAGRIVQRGLRSSPAAYQGQPAARSR